MQCLQGATEKRISALLAHRGQEPLDAADDALLAEDAEYSGQARPHVCPGHGQPRDRLIVAKPEAVLRRERLDGVLDGAVA